MKGYELDKQALGFTGMVLFGALTFRGIIPGAPTGMWQVGALGAFISHFYVIPYPRALKDRFKNRTWKSNRKYLEDKYGVSFNSDGSMYMNIESGYEKPLSNSRRPGSDMYGMGTEGTKLAFGVLTEEEAESQWAKAQVRMQRCRREIKKKDLQI